MANLPQQDTIKQYLADGVQTTFTVPFFVPLEVDGEPNIDVYVQLSGATPVPESDIKVWGVDYTFTENLDPITGGTLNFLVSHVPANDSIVTIVRDVQASLDAEFSNAQNFSGANLDDALDKLLLIEQQNKTYCLQRNLSYVVNSYLPDASLIAQVQIPVLEDGQIWMGTGVGVEAVTLQQSSDVSTLRTELANDAPVTNGARLVGYYDLINVATSTVKLFLDSITPNINKALYVQDTGAVNALVVTPVPALTATPSGTLLRVRVANTTTSNSPTININGLGAGSIFLNNGLSLLPGDMVAGMIAEIIVNNGVYTLLNPYTATRNKKSTSGSAYCSAATSWPGTSPLKVAFDTVETDPLSSFNTGLNRWVANYAGKYRIDVVLAWVLVGGSGSTSGLMSILKNGVLIKRVSGMGTISEVNCFSGSIVVDAAVNDYFEVYLYKTDALTASYAFDATGGTPQECSQFAFEYLGVS